MVCRAAGQLRSNPDPKGEADSSSVSIIGTFFIFIGIPNTEPVVKVVPHEVFRIEHGKVLEHRDVCSTEVQPIVEISGHPEQFIQLVVQLICAPGVLSFGQKPEHHLVGLRGGITRFASSRRSCRSVAA